MLKGPAILSGFFLPGILGGSRTGNVEFRRLIHNSTPGSLVTQGSLSDHGISPQLAQKYVKNGWLRKLRSGVYAHPGKPPQWFNAVECLLTQLNFPIHLAGLSSLAYQGKAHYVQVRQPTIWLQLPPKKVLPQWFKGFPELTTKQSSSDCAHQASQKPPTDKSTHHEWLFVTSNKLTSDNPSDVIKIEVSGTILRASRPELAAFELLGAVPAKISFEHAAEIFQGLTDLSPSKVQSVLSRSNMKKTNRLFLFLANFYNLPFASRIDGSLINLGSGKRQIVPDGIFDKRYQITVPVAFGGNNEQY